MSPPSSAASRRTVWLAAFPVTAIFALSNAATPLYAVWRERLGFSSGTLTVIFACYIAGLLATLVVAGRASDRIGRKPALVPAIALAIAASVIFATASSVLALAVARLFTGIAVGVAVTAGMAAVVDVAAPARVRLGALAASTAMVAGAGLGPLLAGLLSETLPAPTVWVFVAEAVLLLVAAAVVVRLPLAASTDERVRGSWVRVPSVPPDARASLLMGIAVFGPGITATSFVLSLGPSLLADLLGTTSRLIAGGMAFVMFGAATAVQLAAARREPRTVLLAGSAGTAASMVALLLAVHGGWAVVLVLAAILAGAGQGLGQLGGLSLLSATVAASRRAEAKAALNVGGYVPAGLLPVTAGYLGDAVGLRASATVFASVMLAAAIVGALVVIAAARVDRAAEEPLSGGRRAALRPPPSCSRASGSA
jgi:predicted MFS family arabinose efflux permease